ncbi:MAG: IS200/IS605 family transposase [Saprospiraceae bacterium]
MAYLKVLIHAVWVTKRRYPFLNKGIQTALIEHIRNNAKSKDIYVECLNGYKDHLHCLFWLNANMSLSTTMNLLKGESAFWINQQKLSPIKFEWGKKYYAGSVDPNAIKKLRHYINNQESHHNPSLPAGDSPLP